MIDHEIRFTNLTLELARMIGREANDVRYRAMCDQARAEFTKEIGLFLGGKLTVKVEFDFNDNKSEELPPFTTAINPSDSECAGPR